MPTFDRDDRVRLSELKPGDRFRLCRNWLAYELVEHNHKPGRARVEPIAHVTGVLPTIATSLHESCYVINIKGTG